MTLTKNEIVNSMYEQFDIPKKECAQIAEGIFDIIKDELENSNPVMVSGFGKWMVKSKRKRNGRNPKTGAPVVIAARKVVTFKPSTSLKNKVNDDK
jgi:integration host factor subunit alpha